METLRTIWSDIKRDLKQNKAALEIPDRQGWYWTLHTADRLRMLHIQKRRSGQFRKTFNVPILQQDGRVYVELPVDIYDYDRDAGVDSLSYYTTNPSFRRIELVRIDPSEARMHEMSTYRRPTAENPKFWRDGKRLYMLGVSPSAGNMELMVYPTLPDILTVNPDAGFEFPKELIYVLKRAVIDEGRFALSIPGQYLKNDGTNRPREEALGTPEKTVSVNDPMANTGLE